VKVCVWRVVVDVSGWGRDGIDVHQKYNPG